MLKLKRFTKGAWFPYPKAEGVEFLIRPLQLSDGLSLRSKLRKGVATEVLDKRSNKFVTTMLEDVDNNALTLEAFKFMLADFRGPISLETDDSKELRVEDGKTPEEQEKIKTEIKTALFDDEEVRDFVAEKSEFLREHGAKKLEEEQGNLESSQSG